MACYFTLYLECYCQEDAIQIAGRPVSMARVEVGHQNGFWCVLGNPSGPGYSPLGYVEGMNEPEVLKKLEDEIFKCIGSGPGIRRAACGYEAQDWFLNELGEWDGEVVSLNSLLYDRGLRPTPLRQTVETDTADKSEAGTVEFGPWYYRTRSWHSPEEQVRLKRWLGDV